MAGSGSESKTVAFAANRVQHLIDLVCRLHRLLIHDDSMTSIRRGELEIVESPLTKEVEEMKDELTHALRDQTGIVW